MKPKGLDSVGMDDIKSIIGNVYGLWRFKGKEEFDAKSEKDKELDRTTRDSYVDRYVRARFEKSPQGRKYLRS
ncbi:hypothetical protein GW923_03515 [Candidatus Pacearchaeota archaeon]|nr:hypothetical protein [Candidatus Pacearchaeota archaeon]